MPGFRINFDLPAECVECGAPRDLDELEGRGERIIAQMKTADGAVNVVRVSEQSACPGCGGRRVKVRWSLG